MKKSLDQFKLGKAQMNKLGGGINCTFFCNDDPTGTFFDPDVVAPDGMDWQKCEEILNRSYNGLGYTVKCL